MKEYSVYLFDADGTLFDTAELIYQCFVYSCKKYGNRHITRKEVFDSIGLTLRTQFERYLGPMEQERYDQIQADHMDYQMSIYTKYLHAFPGVVETLAGLKSHDKKLGVVTSRKIKSLSVYLRETDMYDFFDILVTPDETKKHKPDAEPVLKALFMLGAQKEKAVYVGDSAYDIECGNNAGVDTVFVNWSHTNGDLLQTAPTFRIDSMEELCP